MFIMDTFFWKYTGCWEYDMINYLQNPLILILFIYSQCNNFQAILITMMKEPAQILEKPLLECPQRNIEDNY